MTPTQPVSATLPVHPRWFIRHDVRPALVIERASFAAPWTEAEFCRILRRADCVGTIAEDCTCDDPDLVAGFMLYRMLKGRFTLLNLAVRPELRRRGVGRQLIAHLVRKLRPWHRRRICVAVRESNLPAQLFFRAQGFQAVSVDRDHYEDTGEDAYVLEYADREA